MPYIKSIRRNFENTNIAQPSSHFEITGGDKIITAGGYRIHFFTTVGEHELVVKPKDYISNSHMAHLQSQNLLVEYLVVGGGGGTGSGGNIIAGGGAGGFLQGRTFVPSGTTSVTVGAGGAANARQNGANSSIGANVIAIGGGYGGWSAPEPGNQGNPSFPGNAGLPGGSGGGQSFNNGPRTNPSGAAGQGTPGGSGDAQTSVHSSGGGGGAGTKGQDGWNPLARGGVGGNGLTTSISGSAVTYAGGGGGGSWTGGNLAPGGTGGGGNGDGANNNGSSTAGAANTGGGGGGGYNNTNARAGGSGIVIARYRV